MKPYRKRIQVPVDPILINVDGQLLPEARLQNFYTKSGTLVAKAYRRVVIGKRGPYMEFHIQDISWSDFYVPKEMEYRLENKVVYYDEWRSIDPANVKLYFQKRTVAYADYKPNMCYISPFDLYTEAMTPVIL